MEGLTRALTKKENEIKTASPVIDAQARVRVNVSYKSGTNDNQTLYETKGFKEYTLRGVKKIMKAYKGRKRLRFWI